VIRAFVPHAVLGPTVRDTAKGAIAHLKPPAESVKRANERARPRWVLLPRYEAGAPVRLEPMRKGRAFMALADNAFNYHLHGPGGFEVLAQLIDGCACFSLAYGDLETAVRTLDALAGKP
jgi:HprK-related kinase A